MENESVFAVEFSLGRGAVILLALLLVATLLVGYMVWDRQEVSASEAGVPLASSADMRQYYLTMTSHNGAGADTACATGYHMASLWEIADPSNLKYNSTLGYSAGDTGGGPTSIVYGWVRTGYNSNNSNTAGEGNCNAWTSIVDTYYGTEVAFNLVWTATPDVAVCEAATATCNVTRRVWCIED